MSERVFRGQNVLRAQRTAFGVGRFGRVCRGSFDRHRFDFREAPRRIPTLVFLRPAELPVVARDEAGSVAAADEKRPFRAELEIADRVRRRLLAPVFEEQFLLGFAPFLDGFVGDRFAPDFGDTRRQPHETTAHRAGVDVGVDRFGAGVAGRVAGAPPARIGAGRLFADHVIEGVEDVYVRPRREARVEGEAEDAAVAVVVDLQLQVREGFRGFVGEVLVDEDLAGLFGDEDLAVGGETEGGRFFDVRERDRVLETAGKGPGPGRTGEQESEEGDRQGPDRAPRSAASRAVLREALSSRKGDGRSPLRDASRTAPRRRQRRPPEPLRFCRVRRGSPEPPRTDHSCSLSSSPPGATCPA